MKMPKGALKRFEQFGPWRTAPLTTAFSFKVYPLFIIIGYKMFTCLHEHSHNTSNVDKDTVETCMQDF